MTAIAQVRIPTPLINVAASIKPHLTDCQGLTRVKRSLPPS